MGSWVHREPFLREKMGISILMRPDFSILDDNSFNIKFITLTERKGSFFIVYCCEDRNFAKNKHEYEE